MRVESSVRAPLARWTTGQSVKVHPIRCAPRAQAGPLFIGGCGLSQVPFLYLLPTTVLGSRPCPLHRRLKVGRGRSLPPSYSILELTCSVEAFQLILVAETCGAVLHQSTAWLRGAPPPPKSGSMMPLPVCCAWLKVCVVMRSVMIVDMRQVPEPGLFHIDDVCRHPGVPACSCSSGGGASA